jgi:hypothetical protein
LPKSTLTVLSLLVDLRRGNGAAVRSLNGSLLPQSVQRTAEKRQCRQGYPPTHRSSSGIRSGLTQKEDNPACLQALAYINVRGCWGNRSMHFGDFAYVALVGQPAVWPERVPQTLALQAQTA